MGVYPNHDKGGEGEIATCAGIECYNGWGDDIKGSLYSVKWMNFRKIFNGFKSEMTPLPGNFPKIHPFYRIQASQRYELPQRHKFSLLGSPCQFKSKVFSLFVKTSPHAKHHFFADSIFFVFYIKITFISA